MASNAVGAVDELQMIGQNEQMFNPEAPVLDATVFDRPAFTYIEVKLKEGQRVMADGEAMIWMDAKLGKGMETEMGDCMPACKRSCAGESCCKNYYTGTGPESSITFGFKLPGDALGFAVTPGQGWIVNSGSFICGTDNLTIDARWSGCRACLPCCGNESAFLTRITVEEGAGVFYAGGYGALNRTEIEEGKRLLMDGGTFFAANQHARFTVAMPGGWFPTPSSLRLAVVVSFLFARARRRRRR